MDLDPPVPEPEGLASAATLRPGLEVLLAQWVLVAGLGALDHALTGTLGVFAPALGLFLGAFLGLRRGLPPTPLLRRLCLGVALLQGVLAGALAWLLVKGQPAATPVAIGAMALLATLVLTLVAADTRGLLGSHRGLRNASRWGDPEDYYGDWR